MTTDFKPLSSGQEEPRVTAVVVTYNRMDLLPKTLAGLAAGRLRPDQVVIINNASTDGTADYLESLNYEIPLDIVHLSKNMGGAGGFTVGIDRALCRHRADLVWVMDDDTEPTESTLAESVRAWKDYSASTGQRPAFVASRVLWTDGKDHPMNTPRTMFGASTRLHRRAAAVGARPIRSASFVSVMMDAAVMRRVGLPIADFFIWNDDFEYTTRLGHHRRAISANESVAYHHTKQRENTDANPGPRFYNDVRNKLWLFCRRRTLTPLEKFLYGGSTARLWISTLLRTEYKKTYAGYLARGIRDALVPFRPNDEVLAGVYELEFPRIAEGIQPLSDSRFSVLMSTYAGDTPEYLEQALASNLVEQKLTPDEMVLVKDGPLPAALETVIGRWAQKSQAGEVPPLKIVELAANTGLANALNEGLAHCSFELVTRADADDISLPERFATQIPQMEGSRTAVLGASMWEMSADGARVDCQRRAKVGADEIFRTLPRRNPIFHPTVVFRKSAVLAVGGYEETPGAEDYWLWIRLARLGFILENCEQALVKYRTGAGVYARRGGFDSFKKDLVVQQTLYTAGATGKLQLAQNLAVRLVYRMAPQNMRQLAFRQLIGKAKKKREG
ncbi:glycosyltransferase family 2 protein [Rothia aerolata]|uniref:glycosyltransferase family 2 protein n=1 Tax=Rothia aerolata TaxID=1812262 RepID=UPI00166CD625|nr:glycosyltransferase [Rothia aerolata]